jgi:flagellar protein FliL
MAAEADKTVVAPDAAAKPAKKKSKLILFGGIGLGVIVLGVVLAVFVLKPMMNKSADSAEATVETEKGKPEKEKSEKKAEAKAEPKKKSEAKGKEGAGGVVYAIKDIVVNPAGTGGSRFLSVSLGFELSSEAAATEFETREPLVRDVLITILSSKTLAELTDAREKEIMRVQIKKRLQQLLESEEPNAVYFTDFVLQ